MQVKFYCDLYISENWMNKKRKIMARLQKNRLQPAVYVIALSQGEQNQLEIFSAMLMKQYVFDDKELFVVGIADGYLDALYLVEEMTEEAYRETGDADIRRWILRRQHEYDGTERKY